VGYNANPAECLERMRELKSVAVRGNHDHYCANDEALDDFHPMAASVVDWTRNQLSREQLDYLRGLNLWKFASGFTLVHSTLDMPDKWGYVFDSLEAEAHFNYQTTAVCFYGHTHLPMVFEKQGRVVKHDYGRFRVEMGCKYFVNVGSVGQPRDGDPRCCYVIYDLASREISFRRLAYDIETTQEKIRKVGLPDRLARRLAKGK
jgi:diadenosine tetraphosphatase ApaH/serine/threonine PP2A family protein phosphatase